MSEVAKLIKQGRLTKGLYQKQLGKKFGCKHGQFISNLEGDRAKASLRLIIKILKYLGTSEWIIKQAIIRDEEEPLNKKLEKLF